MFPQRLKQLRTSRHLTSKALGEEFGVAESTISGYETGSRKPDIVMLEKLATFFRVSVDYLLGRSDDRYLVRESSVKYEIGKPEVQFILRAKDRLSPEAMERFMKFAEKNIELFEDGEKNE